MSRTFPALDVSWIDRRDDETVDRLVAEIDDDHPVALESHERGLRIFFATAEERHRAEIRLTGSDAGLICTPVDVADEDWAARSQASLDPVRVGRVVVSPPWREETRATGDDALVVLIRPSMGFGTGHHATTRLCLALMQLRPLTGARVLDVGTGSGVLALAAWRLGAGMIWALDHDRDSLEAASENLALNAASGSVRLLHADIGLEAAAVTAAAPFDLVLANLTGADLRRHAVRLSQFVARDGRLVVSGVLIDEVEDVTEAFEGTGLNADVRQDEDEWSALGFTTPTGSTTH